MRKLFTLKYSMLILFFFVGINKSIGQVIISNTGIAVIQNFNTLAQSGTTNTWTDNSTIAGWYTNRTVYIGDNGASTTGALYSYGTTASSDRALGGLTSGSTPTVQFGVRLVNNTGGPISGLTISFRGEQWRQTANTQSLVFESQVGATSLTTGTWVLNSDFNFTALKTGTAGALDGNAVGNFSAISATLTVAVANGQEIWLRWTKTGTTSPGLSIDDVSITANSSTSTTPELAVSPGSLNFSSTGAGSTSSSLTYILTGTNLTNNVTVSTAAPYSVSTDNINFNTSLNILKTDPTLATGKTIYVKFSPGAGGSFPGSVSNASVDATTKNVSLTGTGVGLINLATSPYVQNFDGIGTGLPNGVTVKTAASTSALGTDAAFGTSPVNWNSTTGGFKNFASGNNDQGVIQSTATDRALGVRQVGSTDPGIAFAFQLANTIGKINFGLDFNLQSLDVTSPRIVTWRVDYGFGINPSVFIVPATTGDLTTGGNKFSNEPVHVDFGNALDNHNGIITIRIVAITASSGSGNRPSTGIDDFTLSWEDPTAETISLSTAAINFPTTNINTTTTLSYSIISQTNLTQPIILTTTAPYSISADNITFSNTISVNPADAINKSIYVKFSPLSAGVFPGTITHSSSGVVKTITLTGEAIDPAALSFNFNTCSVSNIPGSGFLSINVTGAQQWKCSQYGRNSTNGVDVNGFSGGAAQTNDAWLISPALNLNGIVNIPVLSFYSRGEFTGAKLQLFVSTTYSGSGVPNIGDWSEITTANFPTPPGSATTTWTLSDNIDLTAYKTAPNVYIAFRYTSSVALNAARWSVDDIAITDQSTLLTVSPAQLNFGEVSVGSNSSGQPVSITAIGGDDLTLTPPAGFQISIDNSTFTTNPIVISQAVAAAGTTFYVRFSPLSKALKVEGNINVTSTGLNKNIVALSGSSYPKSETLDMACYNISFFGSNSTNSATSAQIATQVANITTVMQRLNMDVIGIEEMSNDVALAQLVSNLPGYASVMSDRWSYSFNPPDPTFPPQKIGFIYNTNTMTLSTTEPPRAMFASMYDSARLSLPGHRLLNYPTGSGSSFWASGRLPYLATFDATIDGVTQKVRVIVIHAKSGGDAASYARRQYDVQVLKDSIDAFYPNDKVLLIGDYNDRVVTSIYVGHPSSYLPFVNDVTNYDILTRSLDQAGRTSFPNSNGLIDHIAITNDLVGDYIPNSTDIEDPRVYIANYNATTASDHLPVYSRFQFCKLTCPASITVVNTTGQCGAIVNFDVSTTMGCGIVSVVPASGSFFPVGTTTVNVTASTGETCSFTVTVNDTENPLITCPTVAPVLCYNQSGNYTIPAITATDNCGTVTYSYVISGATTRSGTTNNASGAFNTGNSTITWTVTDNHQNSITCVTNVFVNNNITVVIPDAFALPSGTIANTVYIGYAPASSITLTSTANGGATPYSYSWSNGSTSSSITVSPTINTTYTLTVTDANSCQQTATITISVMDIRGGQKLDKVIICHKGNSQIVDGNSITAHLAHGDMLGSCPTASRYVTDTKIIEEERENKLAAQVLPNPSSGFFTILIQSAKTDEKINVRITDVNGRTIEQKQNLFANQTLKVGAAYQPGLYFVEIIQGQEKATIKLIKF